MTATFLSAISKLQCCLGSCGCTGCFKQLIWLMNGVLACYRQDMIVRMMTETSQSTDVSWSLNKLLETALCPGQTKSIAAQASAVTRE